MSVWENASYICSKQYTNVSNKKAISFHSNDIILIVILILIDYIC